MNRRFALAAALAVALGALPVLAQGPGFGPGGPGPQGRGRMGGPGGPGGPGPMLPGLNQLADLTDSQREQIRAIMESSRPSADAGGAVRTAEQALHAAVLAATPNPQAIEAAKAAVNTAHAAELDQRVEVLAKIAAVLTPAQRQQLSALTPPPGRGRGGRPRP